MTDVREIVDDMREVFETAMDARQARIMTALPVKFKKFDEKKLTGEVQPLIKTTIRRADGSIEKTDWPVIQDAPVYFPGGGREDQGSGSGSGGGVSASAGGSGSKKGSMLTFPIKEGDEGIGIVSCRTLDHWYDQGENQEQGSARMHDPSDMMILPGVKSKPRAEEVEGGVNKDNSEFRSVDGKHMHGIDEDSQSGGLYSNTEGKRTVKAKKNIEHETEENYTRKTGKVESAEAGKAITKKAPKILLNST